MERTILVVEDEADIRSLLHTMLLQDGYRVLEATDGGEAVEMARAHRPDVILLDLAMPGMDGLDAARLLREDPATASTPILVMTASTWFLDPSTRRDAGIDQVLPKPFTRDSLLAQLRQLLSAPSAPS